MSGIWGRLGLVLLFSSPVFAPAIHAKTAPPADSDKLAAGNRDEVRLAGTIRGTYTIPRTVPDTGKRYVVTGTGEVRPLGNVQADGQFSSVGFIASGKARGSLTLRNTTGSLTLALVGPSQAGFSPLPTRFDYTVTAATGSFRMALTPGSIHIVLHQEMRQDANGSFVLTFRK